MVDNGSKSQGVLFDVSGLTKSFDGHRQVLSDITFAIGKNEVFGILGPNGAGKTTLVRHLVGFSKVEVGQVEFLGRPIAACDRWLRNYIGYMPQGAASLNHMTCEQALYHTARIRGLSRGEARSSADRLLALWGLEDCRSQDSYTLSGGEARLLRLAVTMIGEPQVLILDEPTAHMDLRYRRRVHRLLADLAASTTIVIVTHDVNEASSILDRAALISDGRLQALGSLEELRGADCHLFRVQVTSANSNAHSGLMNLGLQQIDDEDWTGLVDDHGLIAILALRSDGLVATVKSDPATLEEAAVGSSKHL